MLIFSPKCVHYYVLIILILQLSITKVEPIFSPRAAKIQRAQSMRAFSHSSRTHNVESELRPAAEAAAASTSAVQSETNVHLSEKSSDHQPLIEEVRHVRINDLPILVDPMAMTQSEHINPTRDGVFARAFRYGASAATGVAVGIAAKEFLIPNNNITQPQLQPMNQTTGSDEITNPI